MIRDCYTKDWIEQMGTDQWMISQNTYDPEENLKFESLFALSNVGNLYERTGCIA